MPQPPRVLEWLLEKSLPDDLLARDAVLGDLQEEYGERHARYGRARANAWYLKQTIRSGPGNLRRRAGRGGLMTDLRMTTRALAARPGFAATAVCTLALAIGSATAVFSVADATVLRALPIPDRDRAVSLWTTFDRSPSLEYPLSAAEFTDVRSDVRSFDLVGGWSFARAIVQPDDGSPTRMVDASFTTGDIYALTGARTVAGRLPGPADDTLAAPPVAVISHGLWREAFGADPGIVGTRSVRVGRTEALVIGVLSPGTSLPGYDAGVWVHAVLDPASWASDRSGHGFLAMARLAPGTTRDRADREIAGLHDRWAERYAGQHSFGIEGHALRVKPLVESVLGNARRIALLLATAAGLLLALACANVANLLLARGESRTAETGVRIALGASTRRIVQPILLEGIVLGLAGGAAGFALAAAGVPALLQLAPEGIADLAAVRMDARLLGFTLLLSLFTGIVFSAAPAWRVARRPPQDLLRASGRGRTGTIGGLRLLVGGQAALATVLLSGAALLALSLARLAAVDPGLGQPASRIATRLTLPAERYGSAADIARLQETIDRRLHELPGVARVAAVRVLPIRDQLRHENVLREGDTRPEDRVVVSVQVATPGVLQTLGVRLVEGRDIEPGDRDDRLRVALVNQAAARALWPGESAVGKRLRGTFLPRDTRLLTVAGVYADVRSAGLATEPAPEIMLPLEQAPSLAGWLRSLTLVVETAGAPDALTPALRAALGDIDRGIAIGASIPLDDVVRAAAARERFLATLVSVFGLMALAIAAVGVYGVVAFTVARQRREMAIRNALGAGRAAILAGVVRRHALIAAAGGAAGAAVVVLLSPRLESFLFGVDPRNVFVVVGAPLVLTLAAVFASLAPAIGATRVPLAAVLQQND